MADFTSAQSKLAAASAALKRQAVGRARSRGRRPPSPSRSGSSHPSNQLGRRQSHTLASLHGKAKRASAEEASAKQALKDAKDSVSAATSDFAVFRDPQRNVAQSR